MLPFLLRLKDGPLLFLQPFLGSRVNCEIPDGYTLNVKEGEMVSAGSTIIAQKKNETEED